MAHPVRTPAQRRGALFSTRSLGSAGAVSLILLLSGCSYVSDELWPSLAGEDPSGTNSPATVRQQIPPSQAEANPQPTLSPPTMGTTNFVVPGVTPGQPTGTYVGQKIQQMRGELSQLQSAITQRNQQLQSIRANATKNSQDYHGLVAAVRSEEHTSELQSLMRISYAVFCLKKQHT